MTVAARPRTGNAKCPEPDCSGELWHQCGVRYVCGVCGHVQRQIESRIQEFYERATEVSRCRQ